MSGDALDATSEQRRLLRSMTRKQRLQLAGRLMNLAVQLRDARYRRQFPDLSPEQRQQRCLEDAIQTMSGRPRVRLRS